MKIQKICNITIEYSFIHIPDGSREDERKSEHFTKRKAIRKHHVYENPYNNEGKKHEELFCEAESRKKPEGASKISHMNQRKEWCHLNTLKIGKILNEEKLRPPIEQKDTWNYKEDKVSAHRLQVFGKFSAEVLRSVAYCQHLSHFFPSALKTLISVSPFPDDLSSI